MGRYRAKKPKTKSYDEDVVKIKPAGDGEDEYDALDEFRIKEMPYYRPVGNEVDVFKRAYEEKLPLALKGPTGCGKTRMVEYMAHELDLPVITINCNEDTSATDLVGRYILDAEGTKWVDGPLTKAVREGAILYLDEVVEARKDVMVLIHSLTDHRRILPIDKTGEVLKAHEDFLLVVSYNPGYQSILKEMKPSTRQRFIGIDFDYPPADAEAEIVSHESGIDTETAKDLVKIGEKVRNLKDNGLDEGASTRLLIYAGKLIKNGMDPKEACRAAIVSPLTDEKAMQKSIEEMISSILE